MIVFSFILSLIALLWSANQLVSGASGVAQHYRLPPLLIGLTLVALGTSAPEIMIAISASLEGLNDIAIGNAIGTNIANIGLVLGLTALLKPLKMNSTLMRREFPLLFLVMLFTYSIMLNGYLSILDGCLFIIACLALIFYFIFTTWQHRSEARLASNLQHASLGKRAFGLHVLSLILGLIVLPVSARYLIGSCVAVGHWLGLSDLVMGLTVVAFGTCLPELVTSVVAAVKGADDIAIGNILGSNMFNLLAVMIFPSILHPAAINNAVLWRDIPVMFFTTLILLWINYRNKKRIARWHGGVLVLVYFCYIVSLVISAGALD